MAILWVGFVDRLVGWWEGSWCLRVLKERWLLEISKDHSFGEEGKRGAS
jgi:hypothetical protein